MRPNEAERHEARRRWLTTAQVAEQFGVSVAHVRGLISGGFLRAFNAARPDVDRPDWRVRPEWADEYVQRRTTNGAA